MNGLFLTMVGARFIPTLGVHFSLMSASSELEPHPSGDGMRVRLPIAPPENTSARTLVVRAGVLGGEVARGGRFAWREMTLG